MQQKSSTLIGQLATVHICEHEHGMVKRKHSNKLLIRTSITDQRTVVKLENLKLVPRSGALTQELDPIVGYEFAMRKGK